MNHIVRRDRCRSDIRPKLHPPSDNRQAKDPELGRSALGVPADRHQLLAGLRRDDGGEVLADVVALLGGLDHFTIR
jgi:hypothetical protein